MSASQHITWLNLMEKTGPFLAVSVLDEAFPQGLEKVDTRRRQRVRSAYDEWRDAVDAEDTELAALHREWVRLILEELLEYDSAMLKADDQLPATLVYREPMCGVEVRPTFAATTGETARLLIAVYSADCDLTAPLPGDAWITASPIERMTQLCRSTGVRLGLVTNGERWSVVSVPSEGSSSVATWFARIWQQESVTLQAFVSLLGVRRCFGPTAGTLETLLANSLNDQNEITDTLGEQVRRAVEVLVQALDKADAAQNRTILIGVTPPQLYEAGLTVMMRLVVLLCAEQRGLLLLGVDTYDQYYAITTLRARLIKEQKDLTDDVQERRHDAWARILALCRGVFGGIEHATLRLPPLGGSLFDPDRFSFLEGRAMGTTWRKTPAVPLPIDNRTVLTLLNALQILEQSAGAQFLSYEALDVEQIGHVYEGLLERTVKRVPEVTLGLIGSAKAFHPNIALSELESKLGDGQDSLSAFLIEVTGRSATAVGKALEKSVDDALAHRIAVACGTSLDLIHRLLPFAHLIREDSSKRLLVYHQGAFIITLGNSRRSTGTHYTPKTLTEPIVRYSLEPLVYVGPSEGLSREAWQLKSPADLLALKICDMAMGSAAVLVQVCRYLGERLVEAWEAQEQSGKIVSIEGVVLEQGGDSELLPKDKAERIFIARRLIASRCLYGVDINHMAVELAKLSLWLVTMMKGRPFNFLNHALKCGDSLLGVSSVQQIENFSLRPGERQVTFATANLSRYLDEASTKRCALEDLPSNDYTQIEIKNRLHAEAETATANVKALADALIAFELRSLVGKAYEERRVDEAETMQLLIKHNADSPKGNQTPTIDHLSAYTSVQLAGRRPFHWLIEFPEVFQNGGFNAIIGNPPFIGNKYWQDRLFVGFQRWAELLTGGKVGKIDLVALFFRRAHGLLQDQGRGGLIATTTAREGATLQAGFGWISANGEIYRALSQQAWPGEAGVHVCIVWFGKNVSTIQRILDGRIVDSIPPSLVGHARTRLPLTLVKAPWGFQGSHNGKGDCFVLTPSNVWFNRLREANSPFLRPYLTGDDITTGTYRTPPRWCVDCGDFPLADIETKCSETFRFLIEVVRPARTVENLAPYKGLIDRWWQMWNHRAPLYHKLRERTHCIAIPMVAKYLDVVKLPSAYVFTNKICVLKELSGCQYAALLSSIFEAWVIENGGTMGAGRLTIVLSTGIQTFPLPEQVTTAELSGEQFCSSRDEIMLSRGGGFTNTYNHFHNSDEKSKDIARLRALHIEMDHAVVASYGWNDLDLGHGFHPTKQGERYTISEPARRTVLDRLLALNHQRHDEEVAAGLHDKKTKKKSSGNPNHESFKSEIPQEFQL